MVKIIQGLFKKEKKQEGIDCVNDSIEVLDAAVKSVDEIRTSFIIKLSEITGFKYLKSRSALKRTVGPVVFEVLFFSSKWNEGGRVEINADFRVSYKKYGEVSTVNSVIASKSIRPENDYWFNISTDDLYDQVLNQFAEELSSIAVDLSDRFQKDFIEASRYLLDEKFYEYNVELDFLEDVLGLDLIRYRINEIEESLNDIQRQQIIDYKNGKITAQWMINRCNLHYIVDKNYV